MNLHAGAQLGPHEIVSMIGKAEGFYLQQYLGEIRKRLIERALEIAEGRQNRASKLLGVTPQALSKFLLTKGESKA